MLKAGFARIDITPPFGNDLSGYYERRLADGTLDPLYLNAVALTVGEETVILMAADYIGIKLDHAAKIRELIRERTGVPADHILIAALHQHTSPCLADPETRSTALRDKVFIDVLYRRFADAAVMALDDRADAEMSVGAYARTPDRINIHVRNTERDAEGIGDSFLLKLKMNVKKKHAVLAALVVNINPRAGVAANNFKIHNSYLLI